MRNHDHQPVTDPGNINRAFQFGIALNGAFLLFELLAGLHFNSLALLSDAGHNLSDVASLLLVLISIKLASRKPNRKFTYGYRKTTIMVSLTNAVILLVAVGSILAEGIGRIKHPQVVPGYSIAMVAFIGIAINTISALMFRKAKNKDLNVKGAYLHLTTDALVSMGVVVAGVIIKFTNWYWVDSIMSLLIAVVIVISTWGLLKESIVLMLDGVPKNIDIQKVYDAFGKFTEIKGFHHLHLWAISTTQNALTVHLVVNENLSNTRLFEIKKTLKQNLEQLNINHVTLEIESGDDCEEKGC